MAEDEVAPVKKVHVFSWTGVDCQLTRSLLAAAYRETGQLSEMDKLDHIHDETVPEQAAISVGRPPNAKIMALPGVVDVLRERWLPTLPDKDLCDLAALVQLSLSGPDHDATLRTGAEALEFLRARKRTKNLHINLRRAFIQLHKTLQDAGSISTTVHRVYFEPIELAGANTEPREPFEHQKRAWVSLDELASSSGRRAGLLALPTGSGKTFTMVHWLLERMAHDPRLRVLWIADQQELLEQAYRAFKRGAEELPPDFRRVLRVIHGAAGPVSALADENVDIVCITRQSLVGRSGSVAMAKRLAAFLSRPTVVVVDEAHHTVATTYRGLLDEVERIAPRTMMLGLTATPWPSGQGAIARLNNRFPTTVAEVDVLSLVQDGVLARPTIHTISTGENISLSPDERRQIAHADFTGEILGRLDRTTRNKLIVDTWKSSPQQWGKTLVFVGTIPHADNLAAAFQVEGVPCQVLHSDTGQRDEVLAEFRKARGPRVLVSVGMLLEGVDVPDARTAMLARPTRSHVRLRQMVGRVLRGPRAGGDEIAHVVALEDHWVDGMFGLPPIDLDGIDWTIPDELRLPPVLDEITGGPLVPEYLLRRVKQAYDELFAGPTMTMGEATLIGYYELIDVTVPVFDHTRATWDELIDAKLRGRKMATKSARDYFADLLVPRPTPDDVDAVVDYLKSTEAAPPFVEIKATFSLRASARRLFDQPAMTQQQTFKWERHEYESTLARTVYPNLQGFSEALHRELVMLSEEITTWSNIEAPGVPTPDHDREKLGSSTSRELQPLLDSALKRGWELLDEAGERDYAALLKHPPTVGWTRTPVKSAYAYWIPRISGHKKGQQEIRVNKALRAPATQVPDEVLEFLLWHELCHHVLPGQGHDAEFHRLLFLWPNTARLDFAIEQLSEQYDIGL
jgi:superfamily II DNA or RNA helicase